LSFHGDHTCSIKDYVEKIERLQTYVSVCIPQLFLFYHLTQNEEFFQQLNDFKQYLIEVVVNDSSSANLVELIEKMISHINSYGYSNISIG
jgi:hypothetical protein